MDMAINFKCTMDAFNIMSYTLGALDKLAYTHGITYGLPVFDAYNAGHRSEPVEVKYTQQQFRKLTKFKSSIVLQVLKTKRSVIFCDIDIGWYASPSVLQRYLRFHHTLHIQSNAPFVNLRNRSETAYTHVGTQVQHEPPLGIRRLNSGLYVAPYSNAMIDAFEKILRRTRTSKLSEQPSFYDELCQYDVSSWNGTCTYGTLSVHTLDRRLFRHGAVIYESNSTGYAFHPNWMIGIKSKILALKQSGLWRVNELLMCDFRES